MEKSNNNETEEKCQIFLNSTKNEANEKNWKKEEEGRRKEE